MEGIGITGCLLGNSRFRTVGIYIDWQAPIASRLAPTLLDMSCATDSRHITNPVWERACSRLGFQFSECLLAPYFAFIFKYA